MHPCLMLARNSLALTKRAVESVLAQDIPVELYVIDNDSSDGTPEYLASVEDLAGAYRCSPQVGVSSGWNMGLHRLFLDNEHVLVVNNDVVLRPDTYRELLADGGLFVTAVGVNEEAAIHGAFVKAVRPHPDFSAYMIRRECWQRVGPFDHSMVLYASDADMHVRMHRTGITAHTIGMPFFHYASGTLKTAHPEDAQAIREQADRDRATFEAKWGCKIGSPDYEAIFATPALRSKS